MSFKIDGKPSRSTANVDKAKTQELQEKTRMEKKQKEAQELMDALKGAKTTELRELKPGGLVKTGTIENDKNAPPKNETQKYFDTKSVNSIFKTE